MPDIYDLSRTAADNNDAPPEGAPEGWDGADVNAVQRELMAKIINFLWTGHVWKDLFKDTGVFTVTQDSNNSIDISTSPAEDLTGLFPDGLRCAMTDGATTVYGHVSSSGFSTPVTTINFLMDLGETVQAGCDNVKLYFAMPPVALLTRPQEWERQQNFDAATLAIAAGAVAWDLNDAQCASLTLTEDPVAVTPTNMKDGGTYCLKVIQDGTGSRTINWTSCKWSGGTAPTLSTGANDVDIISFYSDGSFLYGAAVLDLS